MFLFQKWMKQAIEKDLNLDFSKSQNLVIHNSVANHFLENKISNNFGNKKINVLILKNFYIIQICRRFNS